LAYLDPEYYLSVFLVFARIGGLMMAAPFFGQTGVPVRIRIFLAILLAYLLVGLTPRQLPPGVFTTFGLMLAVGIEIVTGLIIGFACQFIFWALQYAGDVFGFQMGLAMAQVFNPLNGQQTNPIARFFVMTVLLVFILLDGPHAILYALITSYDVVPLAGARLAAGGPLLVNWVGALFVTAIRLASPFMITFFLVEAALGIFARAVPQADLFSMSLPLKLLIGLSLSYLVLPHYLPLVPGFIDEMNSNLRDLLNVLAP